MASWPIIGSLAKNTGTLFLERRSARHLKNTLDSLVKYLKAREHCVFFPEGTTAKQGEPLPFHPNLFEGAIHAEMPVQPFALKYVNQDGEFEDAVDLSGDISMRESVNSILGKGRIFAELTLLPLIDSDGLNRKDLCEYSRKAIMAALSQAVQENRDRTPETRHGHSGVQQ